MVKRLPLNKYRGVEGAIHLRTLVNAEEKRTKINKIIICYARSKNSGGR